MESREPSLFCKIHFLVTVIILMLLLGWIWRRESQWYQVQDLIDSVHVLRKKTEELQWGLMKHQAISEQQIIDKAAESARNKILLDHPAHAETLLKKKDKIE